MTSAPGKSTLQRPRSKAAHIKVLDAAIELFAERGIEGTSVDAIAASSGVSKATIYKHWADKNALALEVLIRVHGLDRKPPEFDSGSILQDLIDFLNSKPPDEYAEARDKLMPHLISFASANREFGKSWKARIMEPGLHKARELLQRGVEQGVFPPNLDLVLGVALLIGPMAYKHFARGIAAIPENLAEETAKAFWRAFAVNRPPLSHGPSRKR